mgnify:CR=1 FL=1
MNIGTGENWLESWTGKSAEDWTTLIEGIIKRNSVPREGGGQETKIYVVYDELLDVVHNIVQIHWKAAEHKFDAVILGAQIFSAVTAIWAKSVVIAKAHNPDKYTLTERTGMLPALSKWTAFLINELASQELLKSPWPDQRWEKPEG